ncbi:MAG: ferritin family protein [Phycisphaerae bacterium]|nr:ferritin family protein [Phycisphaerae bacterium]
MNIFEFAIQMEHDGEQFYRDIAGKTTEKGLRNILTMLADDEKKHAEIVADIQSKTPTMEGTVILDAAKNVFQQMKDFGGEFDLSGDEEKLYREAMGMEQKSIGFYLDRTDQAERAEQKSLFKRLAEEEKKHYRLLQDLVDFVARPKSYLADAEFSNLDEY